MQDLEIFKNEEFGEVRTLVIDGEPWFVAKDICDILGIVNPTDALNKGLENFERARFNLGRQGEVNIINESGFYTLVLRSRKSIAKPFRIWVTSKVLPEIRKTGGYVDNDNLFIDTYLPFADENTKLLFSTTLQTIRNQNEQLKLKDQKINSQEKEITHKQEVINGLTDDVPLYKKKDIINRICRRRSGNYANRYKELYKCFRENFHIDLEQKTENYNLKQTKKKDQLTVIKYAEQFGYIDNLYTCCTKLFEAEIDEVLDQINAIHS